VSSRRIALVRPPGDSFSRAVSRDRGREGIDPARARIQHAAYCRLLAEAGLEVVALPPDEAHPDACFTQDPAIVVGRSALLCRFAEVSRRGEQEDMATVLRPLVETIDAVEEPATLEGGDVLAFGRRLVVGRSERTNHAGIGVLARFAEPLGFEVRSAAAPAWALHLGTSASSVGDGIVIGCEETLAQAAFDGLDRIMVPDTDLLACNVVCIGTSVIAAGDHGIHAELQRRGFTVRATDLSEFNRADGSPTCLSLLVGSDPGHPVVP
jgi:dimethylargininase